MRTHGRGSQRLTTGTGRGACSGSYQRHTYTAEEGKLLPHQGYVQKKPRYGGIRTRDTGAAEPPLPAEQTNGHVKENTRGATLFITRVSREHPSRPHNIPAGPPTPLMTRKRAQPITSSRGRRARKKVHTHRHTQPQKKEAAQVRVLSLPVTTNRWRGSVAGCFPMSEAHE